MVGLDPIQELNETLLSTMLDWIFVFSEQMAYMYTMYAWFSFNINWERFADFRLSLNCIGILWIWLMYFERFNPVSVINSHDSHDP